MLLGLSPSYWSGSHKLLFILVSRLQYLDGANEEFRQGCAAARQQLHELIAKLTVSGRACGRFRGCWYLPLLVEATIVDKATQSQHDSPDTLWSSSTLRSPRFSCSRAYQHPLLPILWPYCKPSRPAVLLFPRSLYYIIYIPRLLCEN